MISLDLAPVETVQQHQFISFVGGKSAIAPDPSAYAMHVLGADHNLNNISGGDPSDGFDPWVTDILVYPTSEYWETLLNGERVRPYFDLSISDYNTLRIPSSVHDYDLYADQGRFYEDVLIDGNFSTNGVTIIDGNLELPGDIVAGGNLTLGGDAVVTGDVTADTFRGYTNTKMPVIQVTNDITFDNLNTGYIYQCKPEGANLNITLPEIADIGVSFTVNNCVAGKTVTFPNLINARGKILGEQFSSATIYWDGESWYGIGDLV